MMRMSLRQAHKLAESWKLKGHHVLPILYESEGIQGSRYVLSVGHPLQHVAVLEAPARDKSQTERARAMVSVTERYGGLARLDDSYHERGPGNTGGPRAHSQFRSDSQAADLIADALSTGGGIRALELLTSCPNLTMKLTAYVGRNYENYRRTAQILDQTDANSPSNFVLLQTASTDVVVVFLHPRGSALHIQSAYPTNSTALSRQYHWRLEITEHHGGGRRTTHPPLQR